MKGELLASKGNAEPRPTVIDAELVARLAACDLDTLGILFDRHADELRRFVLRMGVWEGDADDIIQNAFLAAMRAATSFDPQFTARAWLFGIAAMMVRRHRRSMARVAARVREWGRAAATVGAGDGPDVHAEQQQEMARLMRALERLTPKKREAFVLVVLEGVPGEQVARSLGVSVNTIWTRVHHARRELRASVGRVGAEEVTP